MRRRSRMTAPIEAGAYRRMRNVEDAHWWFDGMERITARLLRDAGVGENAEILDAGCGSGRNLGFLAAYGRVTGLDISPLALALCAERGRPRLTRGSVNALPFADGVFDLVTSFDVLMTRGIDDRAALAEFARVLRPGGKALVRVPAYDWLRGRHDKEWAVARRYSRPELREKLLAAGLTPDRISHANAWLLPAAMIKRFAERLFPPAPGASDLAIGAGGWARALAALLASEAPLVARGKGLPCGLSVFALAHKPAPR